MRIRFLIAPLVLAAASPLVAFGDVPETGEATAEGEADPGYVVREEKVINFETGKTETEIIIEFPELEILPDIARPISIIIPRMEPDFDKMPFTIYNNEPSHYLPEEYRLQYYHRVPVNEDTDAKTGDKPRADDSGKSGEENGG